MAERAEPTFPIGRGTELTAGTLGRMVVVGFDSKGIYILNPGVLVLLIWLLVPAVVAPFFTWIFFRVPSLLFIFVISMSSLAALFTLDYWRIRRFQRSGGPARFVREVERRGKVIQWANVTRGKAAFGTSHRSHQFWLYVWTPERRVFSILDVERESLLEVLRAQLRDRLVLRDTDAKSVSR